jgi:hypothetical protein
MNYEKSNTLTSPFVFKSDIMCTTKNLDIFTTIAKEMGVNVRVIAEGGKDSKKCYIDPTAGYHIGPNDTQLEESADDSVLRVPNGKTLISISCDPQIGMKFHQRVNEVLSEKRKLHAQKRPLSG